MVKKKSRTSVFTNLAQQVSNQSTTVECHLIDKEYFAAFDTLDDIQQFQRQVIEKQTQEEEEDDDDEQSADTDEEEIDMKTFAKKYLVDVPETTTHSNSSASSTSIRNKRQRRDIRNLPQSSNFIFMSDDDHGNIFESLKDKRSSSSTRSKRITHDDMESILLTLDIRQKKTNATSQENNESIVIKNEPIEQEQVCDFR